MKIVIIGAGPAGVTVAETLRQYDDAVEIVMLSDEPFPPYSPPAMVEYFSTGKEAHFWKGRDFPERCNVDYRAGTRVVAVQPEWNVVKLQNGEALAYDQLVIATGGRLYTPIVGAEKPGIYNFKSLTAAEKLLREVNEDRAHSALIIGAGFIGVEIALLLNEIGIKVTQLVRSRVMRQMLDPETAEIILAMLQKRGIDVLRGEDADAIEFMGEPEADAVRMRSGKEATADLLIAATGVKPTIGFLDGLDIVTKWGVLVDEYMRTNIPNIYAAGDVAETVDRLTGERYVHAIFPNAVEQGHIVAHNILGWDVTYEGADNMNSLKHLGIPVMAVGHTMGEELRVRENGSLRKIYIQDGCIVGFRLTGDISAAGIYRTLMNKRVEVTRFKDKLLARGFGMGYVEGMALAALFDE